MVAGLLGHYQPGGPFDPSILENLWGQVLGGSMLCPFTGELVCFRQKGCLRHPFTAAPQNRNPLIREFGGRIDTIRVPLGLGDCIKGRPYQP